MYTEFIYQLKKKKKKLKSPKTRLLTLDNTQVFPINEIKQDKITYKLILDGMHQPQVTYILLNLCTNIKIRVGPSIRVDIFVCYC